MYSKYKSFIPKLHDYHFNYIFEIAGIDVIRPKMVETTALGAAMAAAFTLDLWRPGSDISLSSPSATLFHPKMERYKATEKFTRWKEAIRRSIGWAKL